MKSLKIRMSFGKAVTYSMILAGATAMASQIIFLREFLVTFYGNEISIGIILASWLIWGAFGSWFLGRFSDYITARVRMFSICQITLAVVLPITLLFIRATKVIMGIATGEIIGYTPMLISAFVILSLSCSIMGFMFSLACRLYRGVTSDPAKGVAHIYVMEALGALIGGFLVSCFVIRYVTPLGILFSFSFLNILASIIMQQHREEPPRRKILYKFTVILFIFSMVVIPLGGARVLREFSLGYLWKDFKILESKNSIYGNIAVIERGRQKSFYENGLHLYSVPDFLSSEEAVHFALLENEDPEKVLLIGGGVGSLLNEILKHPVSEVDYVELDPTIISEARKYLDPQNASFLNDPKVVIINEDGRFFVKRTTKKYDCIIINLGDPYTIQLNRFYTVGFFKELKSILNTRGVIAFALTSSENYIGAELRDYLQSVYLSVSEVFPDILLIPGDTMHFIACSDADVLTDDTNILMARMQARGINTKYVREYYIFDKLSKERMKYAKDIVGGKTDVNTNRDFRPSAYYYATMFWGTHFDASFFRGFLRSIKIKNIWMLVGLSCFGILLFGILDRKRRGKRIVLLSVMTTGFAEINFQIAVVLSFQVIYGYVFYKLGIILTFFMVGLALGGWIISKYMDRIRDYIGVFSWTQVSICMYPLILPPFFLWLSRTQSDTVSWLGANFIFPFFPIIAGVIGGIQFPLANKIYLKHKDELGRVAGLSYGLDLLGACLGSLLAAAFLVPLLGVFQTCFLVAVINTTVLAALLVARKPAAEIRL